MNFAFQRKLHLAGSSIVEVAYLLTGMASEKTRLDVSCTSFAGRIGQHAMVLVPAIVAEIARELAGRQIQLPELRLAPPVGDEELHRIVDRLKATQAEIRAEFRDVSRREQAWRTFQRLVAGALWEAVEDLEDDPHRRQLADVLDAAVARLQAFQIEEKHLAAIDLTLERLAAPQVTERDVDSCESSWQAAAVDTILSLGEVFEEWMELSGPDLDDVD